MRLLSDERGAVYAYLTFWIVVVICGLIWGIFNEMVLHVSDWATASATQATGGTWEILLTLYRLSPMVVILSAFIWAVVQSHKAPEVGYQ